MGPLISITLTLLCSRIIPIGLSLFFHGSVYAGSFFWPSTLILKVPALAMIFSTPYKYIIKYSTLPSTPAFDTMSNVLRIDTNMDLIPNQNVSTMQKGL